MIGISRGQFPKPLKNRQLKELFKSQSKQVESAGGEQLSQLFCRDCSMPIEMNKHFFNEGGLVCSACYWVNNLDLLSVKTPGYLILSPELTQQEVTSFAIALQFTAEYPDTEEVCEEMETFFSEKREALERKLGEGTSDPSILCQFLYSLSDSDYESRGRILSDVRLFPSEEFLRDVVSFLKTNELKKYSPEKWVGLLQHVNVEMSKHKNIE